MNQLSLVIVALVVFTYFGGSYVPNVLKSNKQMLLGVVGGLVLGSFFGVRLVEGMGPPCLSAFFKTFSSDRLCYQQGEGKNSCDDLCE